MNGGSITAVALSLAGGGGVAVGVGLVKLSQTVAIVAERTQNLTDRLTKVEEDIYKPATRFRTPGDFSS